jgi:hypothetical protein
MELYAYLTTAKYPNSVTSMAKELKAKQKNFNQQASVLVL